MGSEERRKFEWQLLEMPKGISTSNGNWYQTTREGIEHYVPGLLKRYSLERLIRDADEWLESANSLALLFYLLLPFTGMDPVICFGAAMTFYFLWYFNSSAFVYPGLSKVIRVLNADGLLYVLSAGVLIYFAWQELYLTMWLGIVLFFLFKVGLLNLILKLYTSKQGDAVKSGRPDRILNMVLIRYGMKEGLMPNHIQSMQDDLLDTVNYHKTRKKKD